MSAPPPRKSLVKGERFLRIEGGAEFAGFRGRAAAGLARTAGGASPGKGGKRGASPAGRVGLRGAGRGACAAGRRFPTPWPDGEPSGLWSGAVRVRTRPEPGPPRPRRHSVVLLRSGEGACESEGRPTRHTRPAACRRPARGCATAKEMGEQGTKACQVWGSNPRPQTGIRA